MIKSNNDAEQVIDQIGKQKSKSRVRKIRSSMQKRDVTPQPFVKIKAKQDFGGKI